jgi:hypothetical protein
VLEIYDYLIESPHIGEAYDIIQMSASFTVIVKNWNISGSNATTPLSSSFVYVCD